MFKIVRGVTTLCGMAGLAMIFLHGCSEKSDSSRFFDMSLVTSGDIENIIPIAIVGSGPAGLMAGVYGSRALIDTVVFMGSKPGGLLTETTDVENWPGIPSKLGPDIMKDLQIQSKKFGAELVFETIESVDFSAWPYTLTTEDGLEVKALTVIVATGASPRLLGIPGEKKYWGAGVTTCAVCDAPFYRDEEVVVIGGGDSAAEEAIQLSPYASKVTVLVRKGAMRASASMRETMKGYPNIEVMYHKEVRKILGDGEQVTGVELYDPTTKETTEFSTAGVFIAIGHIPNTKLFEGQLNLDDNGYIELKGRSQETSILGVYAAGDVEDHRYRQAGVAAGSGIKAALDALERLTAIGYNVEASQAVKQRQYKPRARNRAELESITTLRELKELLAQDSELVLVDFYTDYCPTCLQMLPIIETLAHEFADKITVVKVDADDSKELVEEFKVLKVPCLLIFQDGELAARFNTTFTKPELQDLIQKYLA